MVLNHLIKNPEKRKRVVHIVAGVVILIHAYDNYQTGHHSYKLFAIAGTVFLIIALLHPVIERKVPWIDGVFLIIEGFLSLAVAFDFFSHGKKALPTAYLFLGLFQFFMAYKRGRKASIVHKQTHNIHKEL